MVIESLGGDLFGTIPLGDIVLYLNPLHLFLFVTILLFTVLIAVSRTETQIEALFGSLEENEVKVGKKEFKQRRFLAVICGIATAGAMITGDLFNFTLFMA
jgi:energy-converting hydrogenase A subunit H